MVYTCSRKRDGHVFAVKVLKISSVEHHILLQIREFSHPNLIMLEEAFREESMVYMVIELATGGELYKKIVKNQTFNEHDARTIMVQLLHGLEYLHAHGIAHRDIKPENILFNGPTLNFLKISDFGLSKICKDSNMYTMAGTAPYIAPEILAVNGYGGKRSELREYTHSCDIWSAGVVVFVLLSGETPFNDSATLTRFQAIRAGSYSFKHTVWNNVSDLAKNLIREMLSVDTTTRLSANSALPHDWFFVDMAE